MTTKTLDFQCELKANGDTGTFEGYGSIFNITDRGGDIVAAGAFAETLAAAKTAGRLPAMLWQHNTRGGDADQLPKGSAATNPAQPEAKP
jgi:phage head maturation protease